jgi:hypothetical protein
VNDNIIAKSRMRVNREKLNAECHPQFGFILQCLYEIWGRNLLALHQVCDRALVSRFVCGDLGLCLGSRR